MTMDRYEADWDMVKRGYQCHVQGQGTRFESAAQAVQHFYDQDPNIDDHVADPGADQGLVPPVNPTPHHSADPHAQPQQKGEPQRKELAGDHDVMGRKTETSYGVGRRNRNQRGTQRLLFRD